MRSCFVIAAVLAIAGIATCAPMAAYAQACSTMAEVVAQHPRFTHVEVKGADKVRLVANYNATEPVSDWNPDEVWVSFAKDDKVVHISLISGGCVVAQDAIPNEAFLAMMTSEPKAAGDPA